MAQAAVLITHCEVFGAIPSTGDLRTLLSKYQRLEVLVLLAKLNCLLGTWRNTPAFDVDSKLCASAFPDYGSKIEAIRRASSVDRLVFTRLTILYVLKEASLTCPDQGALVRNPREVQDIGVCCLMANDLALTNQPSRFDTTLERLSSLLPFCDYVSQDEYPIEIARSLTMFEETAKNTSLASRADFVDLQSLFTERIGLTPRSFCELVFGAATRYLNMNLPELEQSAEALLLRPEYFRNSVVPKRSIEQFFKKISIPEAEFCKQVSACRDRPASDLTIIQKYPVLQALNGLHFCIDPGFLVDKAGRALFWSLLSEVPDNRERLSLMSFWGTVFEWYVNSLLEECYTSGRLLIGPNFENGDQAFDACMVEGRTLVVMEHKSSVLRAEAKYGGDAQRLKQELETKFIVGDDEGRKGLAQLENHIRRFLGGDDIADLSSRSVTSVYPVLVCLDRSLVVPYMCRYLNDRFPGCSLRKQYKKTVTPVFTLSVSEIECLLPYLATLTLSEILQSYNRNNPKMMQSLLSCTVPLLLSTEHGESPIRRKFSDFAKQMEKDLFSAALDEKEHLN